MIKHFIDIDQFTKKKLDKLIYEAKLIKKYPNTDHLIHGHTHRQNTHKMDRYTRYVLGDWKNNQGNAIKLGESLDWLEIN